jgi:hypothetical protein
MSVHEGGCLCGRVRYRFEGAAPATNVCYCRSCRMATGGPVVAFADLAPGQFAWIAGDPAFYASSPKVRRGFCAHCGTSLTYENKDAPDGVHVLSVTLDDPTPFAPAAEFYAEERIPWIRAVVRPNSAEKGTP